MTSTTAADVPLLILSENHRSEKRISPAWTIDQLKGRLEPILGIPTSAQRLSLKIGSRPAQSLEATGDTQLSNFPLQQYAEIHVQDTRPPAQRANYTDVSRVQKYEMPAAEYESRGDSVLAYKRTHQLGRFDPAAPSVEQQKIRAAQREVEERGVAVGRRCRLLPADSDARRGVVGFVGDVHEIPGLGPWVGVVLDEPTGKNDGSVQGTRYFECGPKCGVFVRAERVEIGDFPALDDLDMDEEF